jgi:tRNA 2-selenouridine synthase
MSTVLYPGSRIDVGSLAAHPERIDVRSPAEFAEDHIPGAHNCPVLDDQERARVGVLHASSPFEARKVGAALVARNIATMLETAFANHPREWNPLVYCWRGGQRSRAVTHVLNEVGWRAVQLDGGYRAYRRHVVTRLALEPARYRFVVLCALTGSGKSQLLGALAEAGAQVLDLARIARHRGSLRASPSLRRRGSRPSCSRRFQRSIPSARCMWKQRAGGSARSSCPMHCSNACARARRSRCARRWRSAFNCSAPSITTF